MKIEFSKLNSCVKNIGSISELDEYKVYLFSLNVPLDQFKSVANCLMEILTENNIKGMIIPSKILNNIYELSSDSEKLDNKEISW